MRLFYLGTAAAEGWPAPFCHCDNCKNARIKRGKNLRSRPQVLINDDLLMDYGPDTFSHSLQYGLELDRVKTVLLTHSHSDHFHPLDLILRSGPYAFGQDREAMRLFGNEKCHQMYQELLVHPEAPEHLAADIHFTTAQAFHPFDSGSYHILPLKAAHDPRENCLLYAVSDACGKTIFYGNDTGAICPETWDAVRSLHFHLVSLDCTMGTRSACESHLNLEACFQIRENMLREGCADSSTTFIITHFSHGCCPLHDDLSALAAAGGFLTAYDGMTVTV
ncbi:MAG: hypothetical protein K2G51_01160 [Lachnospiraceae bacterium]|nr:hypothetical protein [Lachnospiraceae bacterium]